MKILVFACIAVMGCGGPQPEPWDHGLRTHTEENDLRNRKKKEKDKQAAQKKPVEEPVGNPPIEPVEVEPPREDVENPRRDEQMKKEAEAIKAFTSVAERQVIPLVQTFPDKVLCPFDAEHLPGAACDLAVIGSDTVRMSVERSPAADGQPPTWTVTGSQFDTLSQSSGPPVTVCRLVVRNRMLRLEWPNPEISPQHALFRTVENGLLIVSCKTAAGDSEIRRQILFAEPIDLAASGAAEIALDPLAGKDEARFDPRIVARLKVIEPSALRWSLEVTHPQWTRPEQLRTPDTQLTVQLPSATLPGVAIEYLDFDAKSKSLVKRASDIRLEAVLTFFPQEASLKLDSELTGLDTMPLLKSVITVEALRNAFRGPRGLDPLEKAVQKVLQDRFLNNEKHHVLAFDAFAKDSDDCKKLGITNLASFESHRQKLERERAAIRVPGTVYPAPNGIGSIMYNDEREYKLRLDASTRNFAELKRIEAAFVNGEKDRARQEAIDIRKALEDSATWFGPITVKIRSLSALATDSKGLEYAIPIVKQPDK